MSILRQSFTIEKYDRTETQCSDIAKLVEKHFNDFRQLFGVAFNYKRVSATKYYSWTAYPRYQRHTHSQYLVSTSQNVYSRWCDPIQQASTDYFVDCQYLIRDGFGRVVHPDVIYKAYISERGIPKKPRMIHTRFGSFYQRRASRWDNGARQYCCVGYNNQYRFKQLLSEVMFSKLNLNSIEDELVESEYDLVNEPCVRQGLDNDALSYGRDWELPRGSNHKSWKCQSKARKQWAKNQK